MNQRPFAAIAALCLAPLGAAWAATPVDREVDADANGTVEVHNVSGSVQIEGSSRRTVHVTGNLADNVERLDVKRDGNRVLVDVVMRKDSHSSSNEHTALTIAAPQGSRLEVSTVSASVDTRGIAGEQELRSVSGSIRTEALGGDLTLSTVSGSIAAQGRGTGGVTEAHSVSGTVELAGVSGRISAEAVSGSVKVTADKIERASLRTISGDASLRGTLADDARVDLTSTSGDLDMRFTGKAEGDYELNSFSGAIKSCFGPPVAEARHGPERQQNFREGASSARVQAHTMSGRIDLCRE